MGDDGCTDRIFGSVAVGLTFGGVHGALIERWKTPPTPMPSEKVFLDLGRPDTGRRVLQGMGQRAGIMAAVAGAYSVGECTAESFRGKNDPVNSALGGCAGGAVVGFQRKKVSAVCGGCLLGAIFAYAIESQGNLISADPMRNAAKRLGLRTPLNAAEEAQELDDA